jgi:hypothetical protein
VFFRIINSIFGSNSFHSILSFVLSPSLLLPEFLIELSLYVETLHLLLKLLFVSIIELISLTQLQPFFGELSRFILPMLRRRFQGLQYAIIARSVFDVIIGLFSEC